MPDAPPDRAAAAAYAEAARIEAARIEAQRIEAQPTEEWHLVRVPTPAQLARRRGFPPDRVDNPRMQEWCARTCAKGWRVEESTDAGTVYLFEDRSEALAFALRWFPFKCG